MQLPLEKKRESAEQEKTAIEQILEKDIEAKRIGELVEQAIKLEEELPKDPNTLLGALWIILAGKAEDDSFIRSEYNESLEDEKDIENIYSLAKKIIVSNLLSTSKDGEDESEFWQILFAALPTEEVADEKAGHIVALHYLKMAKVFDIVLRNNKEFRALFEERIFEFMFQNDFFDSSIWFKEIDTYLYNLNKKIGGAQWDSSNENPLSVLKDLLDIKRVSPDVYDPRSEVSKKNLAIATKFQKICGFYNALLDDPKKDDYINKFWDRLLDQLTEEDVPGAEHTQAYIEDLQEEILKYIYVIEYFGVFLKENKAISKAFLDKADNFLEKNLKKAHITKVRIVDDLSSKIQELRSHIDAPSVKLTDESASSPPTSDVKNSLDEKTQLRKEREDSKSNLSKGANLVTSAKEKKESPFPALKLLLSKTSYLKEYKPGEQTKILKDVYEKAYGFYEQLPADRSDTTKFWEILLENLTVTKVIQETDEYASNEKDYLDFSSQAYNEIWKHWFQNGGINNNLAEFSVFLKKANQFVSANKKSADKLDGLPMNWLELQSWVDVYNVQLSENSHERIQEIPFPKVIRPFKRFLNQLWGFNTDDIKPAWQYGWHFFSGAIFALFKLPQRLLTPFNDWVRSETNQSTRSVGRDLGMRVLQFINFILKLVIWPDQLSREQESGWVKGAIVLVNILIWLGIGLALPPLLGMAGWTWTMGYLPSVFASLEMISIGTIPLFVGLAGATYALLYQLVSWIEQRFRFNYVTTYLPADNDTAQFLEVHDLKPSTSTPENINDVTQTLPETQTRASTSDSSNTDESTEASDSKSVGKPADTPAPIADPKTPQVLHEPSDFSVSVLNRVRTVSDDKQRMRSDSESSSSSDANVENNLVPDSRLSDLLVEGLQDADSSKQEKSDLKQISNLDAKRLSVSDDNHLQVEALDITYPSLKSIHLKTSEESDKTKSLSKQIEDLEDSSKSSKDSDGASRHSSIDQPLYNPAGVPGTYFDRSRPTTPVDDLGANSALSTPRRQISTDSAPGTPGLP